MSKEVAPPDSITVNLSTLTKVTKAQEVIRKYHTDEGKKLLLTNGSNSIRVDETVEAIFSGIERGAINELLDEGQGEAVQSVRFAGRVWRELNENE